MTPHHNLLWRGKRASCSCRWDEIVLHLCSAWVSDSPRPSAATVVTTLPHMDFPTTLRAAKLFRKLPRAHWTAAPGKAKETARSRAEEGEKEESSGNRRRDAGVGGTPGDEVWCIRHKCTFNDYLNPHLL